MSRSNSIEQLESRRLLAAITVTGSSGADEIRVWVNGSTLLADVNGFTQSYPDFLYNGVSITASGGADSIYIDSNGDNPVTVNAGSGVDQVFLGQAPGSMDEITSLVTFINPAGDELFLHDDNVAWADTYTVNNSSVTRSSFVGVSTTGFSSVRLFAGDGADTFNVINTNGVPLILDGQGGDDILNLNVAGTGAAEVVFESNQDFAHIDSEPGGNLTLTGGAGLLLTTNLSNFEGNVTLDRGFLIERNNAAVSGGLNYWRGRIARGATSTTPFLRSSFAASSSIGDGIGYAYADTLTLEGVGPYSIQSGDLVMMYTLQGDANLDRDVNFDDLLIVAQNYGSSSRNWWQGDFTGDQTVNFDDLLPLAQNYGQNATPTLVAAKAATRRKPARAGVV